MSGIVIFLITLLAIAICAIADEIRIKKPKELERKNLAYVSDFSPSAYMGRIEQAAVEIMQEAHKRPKYQLVLWAGLDGLRLNDDGTSTWIRREEEKQEAVAQLQNVSCETMQNPFAGCQNITCQIDNNIRRLQAQMDMQMQNLCIQQAMMQNRMVSAVHPAYMSAYTPYYQPTYYSAVNQCCVRQ